MFIKILILFLNFYVFIYCSDMEEAVSRGLDNLGRVHARHGNFEKAVQV